MPKHGRNLGPIDEKYAEALRGRLAQYRLDCLERKQPLQAKLPETGDARLNEILEPLYAVTPDPTVHDYHVILEREKTLRLERIRETYEYAVLEAFASVVTEDMQDACLILTETVTDAYNQRHASKATTNRSIGRTLARLGFKTGREDDKVAGKWISRRGYRLNRALLSRLKTEYDFDEEPKEESGTQPTLEKVVTDQAPALPSSPASLRDGILPASGQKEDRQLSLTNAGNDGNAGDTDKQAGSAQVKVRVDWNASPDTKALVDKALELEREDDKANGRTPRSKSSIIDTVMRQGLSRYLAERSAIRKQPARETHA